MRGSHPGWAALAEPKAHSSEGSPLGSAAGYGTPGLPLDREATRASLGFDSVHAPVTARDGRWFSVRIMPYRTTDDRVDGVVITFADITAAKTLEAKLRARQPGPDGRAAKNSAPRKRTKSARRLK